MRLRVAIVAAALLAVAQAGWGQAKEFTIGTSGSEAQQIATVESRADFETFVGRTAKVTGKLTYDPKKRTGSGYIEVDANSIDTGIALRNDHMRSPQWLDTARFPTIRFETTNVQRINGDNFRVTGRFSLHGVTRTITVTARVRYLPESETTRRARFKGDVLHVDVSFPVKLSDYGIKISPAAVGKVSDTVTINVTAFASSGA
jgi:polyisoprenoid-binding protein YceI